MKRWFHKIGWHLVILGGFYVVFAGITFLLLTPQSPTDSEKCWGGAATFGAITGPFTGAIARKLQPPYWQNSMSYFPACAVALGASLFFQLFPVPRPFRLLIWSLGLLCWFAGVLLSLSHAL